MISNTLCKNYHKQHSVLYTAASNIDSLLKYMLKRLLIQKAEKICQIPLSYFIKDMVFVLFGDISKLTAAQSYCNQGLSILLFNTEVPEPQKNNNTKKFTTYSHISYNSIMCFNFISFAFCSIPFTVLFHLHFHLAL